MKKTYSQKRYEFLIPVTFSLIICILFPQYSFTVEIDVDKNGNMRPHGIIGESSTNTIVNKEGNTYYIQNGKTVANALFHDFDKFNVHSQETVIFEDSVIKSTVARVTGVSSSWINGTIQSNAPHFYLLNPNGIFFGVNAQLNIQGAFTASISDYNEYNLYSNDFNQRLFNHSYLRCKSPEEFGFLGDSSAFLELKSDSNSIFIEGNNIVLENIKLRPINSLTISADNLSVNNTTIDASSSNNLPGKISIHVSDTVFFSNNSIIDTSSKGKISGDIDIINAKHIVFDQSKIYSVSINSKISGNITLLSTESISFFNYSVIANSGKIVTDARNETETQGCLGDIFITSKKICFLEGSGISSHVEGDGSGGNIHIFGDHILFSGTGNGKDGRITTKTINGNQFNAGNVSIKSNELIFQNGAGITSTTEAFGNGGNVTLDTDRLTLKTGSSIKVGGENATLTGNAGTIIIGKNIQRDENNAIQSIQTAESIYLLNSQISTHIKEGNGNAGDISVNSEMCILNRSTIIADADEGNGGAIFIKANHFIASSDSQVSAHSDRGNDGEIHIESIDLDVTEGLNQLPSKPLNAFKWLTTPCKLRKGDNSSHLVQDVRYAIPASVEDWIASPPLLYFTSRSDFLSLTPVMNISSLLLNQNTSENAISTMESILTSSQKADDLYYYTLLQLVAYYQSMGFHDKALFHFNQAMPKVENAMKNHYSALLFNTMADLHLSIGKIKKAEHYMKVAKDSCPNIQHPIITASMLNNKGILLAVIEYNNEMKDYQNAIESFEKCLEQIEQTDQANTLKAKALINLAHAQLLNNDFISSYENLQKAFSIVQLFPNSNDTAGDLLSIAVLFMRLGQQFHLSCNQCIIHAYDALKLARQVSKEIDNTKLRSMSYGYMSQLYAIAKQYNDAIKLIQKAIFYAQEEKFPEILYEWQWQHAKLLKKLGNINASVIAYQNAITTLNPIRREFFRGYRSNDLSFYHRVRPVYLELTELFLSEAQTSHNLNMLKNARDTIERLKKMEIEDYYQDECLHIDKQTPIDVTEPGCALLYPISFTDRLVLLVILPEGMKLINVSVSSDEIKRNIRLFHKRLWQIELSLNRSHYYPGVLYEWLVQPLESEFEDYNINTLYIVPDGILRSIPFGALYDGHQYLIEKYALIILPGASLSEKKPAKINDMQILLAGLSKSRFDFSALKHVKDEIYGIAEKLNVKSHNLLFNQTFTLNNIKQSLKDNIYSLIHMSTHACFNPSLEDTFLLTYDEKISIKQLRTLIQLNQYQDEKIELLTLSACQTALGNERALLGLAGVALKAGAKNALATLWRVDDKATSILLTDFYNQLSKPGISKSKALQYAQKNLIRQNEFSKFKRPLYWAPFILIGS